MRIRVTVDNERCITPWVRVSGPQMGPMEGGPFELPLPRNSTGSLTIEVYIDNISDENEADWRLGCCPDSIKQCCCCLFCCPCYCAGYLARVPLQGMYLATAKGVDLVANGAKLCTRTLPLSTFHSASAGIQRFIIDAPTVSSTRTRNIHGSSKIAMDVHFLREDALLQASDVQIQGNTSSQFPHVFPVNNNDFLAVTTMDMLKLERLQQHMQLWMEGYQNNELVTTSAPPVKKVVSIYGTNVKTQIRQVFRRRSGYTNQIGKQSFKLFELDSKAKLPKDFLDRNGYVFNGGKVFETEASPQIDLDTGTPVFKSGDGTVSYDSLQHVKRWRGDCQVEILELPGAEHRAMLADIRVHEAVLQYCKYSPPQVQVQTTTMSLT